MYKNIINTEIAKSNVIFRSVFWMPIANVSRVTEM